MDDVYFAPVSVPREYFLAMTTRHLQNPPQQPDGPHADGGVDLIDLALIVWRRRRLVLSFIIFSLMVGIAFAFLKNPTYEYKAVIEIGLQEKAAVDIGQWIQDRGETVPQMLPLESTETVLAKVNGGYLPKAVASVRAENPALPALTIEATSPKKSTVVILAARAPLSHRDLYLKAIDSAVQELLEDHASLIAGKRDAIRSSIMRARAESVLLDQRLSAIRADLEKLSSRQQTTAIQLDEMQKHANAAPQWVATLQSTLALLQSRIDQLENERSALQKAKSAKESEIALLESQAQNLRATRLVHGPRVSAEPVGIGRSIILALALVIGAFAGLMAAFIAEFVANVRARLNSESVTDAMPCHD